MVDGTAVEAILLGGSVRRLIKIFDFQDGGGGVFMLLKKDY